MKNKKNVYEQCNGNVMFETCSIVHISIMCCSLFKIRNKSSAKRKKIIIIMNINLLFAEELMYARNNLLAKVSKIPNSLLIS